MIDQNHQYFQLANHLYPKIVTGLVQNRYISPQEGDWLMNKNNVGNEFTNFVQNCIANIPALNGEAHMESLIVDNLIKPMVNQLRQGYRGGYFTGGGGGGFYGGGGGYGGGMRFATGGYGGGNPAASGWYTGRRTMMPGGGGGFYGGQRSMFTGAPGRQNPAVPKKEEKKEPPKPEIKWVEPTRMPESDVNQDNPNNTSFSIRKFVGFDNSLVTEVFVIDDRPIYKSDAEAIAAYQNLFDDESKSRKFLTVCYRQLKTIHVNRSAFRDLVKAVAVAVGRYGDDDVAQKIKAVITISAEHPSGAANALSNLIVEEFNEHVHSGELTDATKGHLDWKIAANNLQGIYDMLTGNLDKQTRETLHQIKNFDDALKRIVQKVINTVIANGTAQRILDPTTDKSIMDIYGRAIPPVWYNGTNNVWEATENFFTKFLASKKTINGSKPDSALVAEQTLMTKIGLTDKNYAVLQVPRIITWCNCSSTEIVNWGSDGKCLPRVFGAEDIKSDTVFFLNRAIIRINKSKLTSYSACPKKIVCEVDEGSIRLDYGLTSDGGLWTGCLRYKY